VSVTNVDLSGTVTLKMVKLTNLDLSLEHVHLWLSFHFRASIFYCELNLKDTMKWTLYVPYANHGNDFHFSIGLHLYMRHQY